jgi:hypothetical protein
VVATPEEAVRAVESVANPTRTAVVTAERAVVQGRGTARLLESTPDRLVIAVDGAGGVLALRRAYQPLLAARDGSGRELVTVPVHAMLLGVVVPPGGHRVVVAVDERPTAAAAVVGVLALVGAVAVAATARRRRSVS